MLEAAAAVAVPLEPRERTSERTSEKVGTRDHHYCVRQIKRRRLPLTPMDPGGTATTVVPWQELTTSFVDFMTAAKTTVNCKEKKFFKDFSYQLDRKKSKASKLSS